MSFSSANTSELSDPLLGFRFGVFFLGPVGLAHRLDFRFSKVSGLGIRIDDDSAQPKFANLVLERGFPLVSSLRNEFMESLTGAQVVSRNVLVSLLDESGLALNSWMLTEATPVAWSLAPFDANSPEVLIETLELKYTGLTPLSL